MARTPHPDPEAPSLRLATDRRFDVLAIGENSLDFLAFCQPGPAVAGKAALSALRPESGGQMATAALACARLGLRTRYVGAFGDDEWAPLVRAPLLAHGVDVLSLPVRPGTPSRTAIIVVSEDGDRRIYEHRSPGLLADADAVSSDVIAETRVLLVDATHAALARRAVEHAKQAGVLTICDVDRPGADTESLLAVIDVAVMPAELATLMTGERDPVRAVADLADGYPDARLVVATCGADGSVCRCAGRTITTPAFAVDVVDTTGAGDTFRAGLAAGLVHLGPAPTPDDVLGMANAAAALNCRAPGAQAGLPTLDEVTGLLARRRPSR